MNTTIGQRLKKVLEEKGMMQKELAEKAGINELAVSRYVHDDRIPQTLIVIEICRALNISSDWLLGLKETEDMGIER